MKKGINMGAVPGNLTLEEAFEMIARAGFDGVELNMADQPRSDGKISLHTDCSHAELLAIKETAEKYNLEITSFVTGLLWSYPLTSYDKNTREHGKDAVKKLIDYAAFFNSDTVLVVPGQVNEMTHYEDAYYNAQTALKELAPYAEERKIYIGVENVWNKFLLSPLEMRDFVDSIGSEYVGVYFDIGNVLINAYPEQWIKILGTRIKKYHAKGFKTAVGNITGFTTLLEGDINWKRVMDEIRKTGYDNFITAELGAYKFGAFNLLKETAEAFDMIFGL
ncbi:MAG: sugar phosphate isomerase/epimerase [Oscillospiraceae bacterium]|nr:sugar phosphate isomerase/epimerase [Oscillospiraceae bacterium]